MWITFDETTEFTEARYRAVMATVEKPAREIKTGTQKRAEERERQEPPAPDGKPK